MRKEELAMQFDLLSRLLKVIRDNPFKIRTYEFAARIIRSNLPEGRLSDGDITKLLEIRGIGKAVVDKSLEYLQKGEISKVCEISDEMPSPIYLLTSHNLVDTEVISFMWKDMAIVEPQEIISFLTSRKESLKLSSDRLSEIEALLKGLKASEN
ncbi:DNA polymerase IV (family X)-like protein [Mesotoga sp. Brook.08.YT.4.2.5.1]|uniref:DNA polymerase IV (Family X)-like protein n=1 Tax=Mesotoga prima TaxID=1184387 RepID=A0A101HSC7_9BACT|nr:MULTISPECIES: helix-hairpin-helix domain-containing protein [unclassified Mesotoga]KUK82246.1 MAG: DNA polymerase IV (Family X)-like protein [Mesotoga prima]RAM60619.1 DNA polymerase IV (family X)-like protein [Mesotoga sp. SC_4PWA21]PNE23000.1 DNA polymerase IV (family X)-like protein [Mesotoga sp. Brook.08.YT.4.2.5.1]PNS42070.1 DNA polymerase IV (family X)-like protein [Mesotoga sp. B105.6.4]PVD15931.1 hypothetical protein V512_003135 [Mesotoga sp. Brook.08.105.5.1]